MALAARAYRSPSSFCLVRSIPEIWAKPVELWLAVDPPTDTEVGPAAAAIPLRRLLLATLETIVQSVPSPTTEIRERTRRRARLVPTAQVRIPTN